MIDIARLRYDLRALTPDGAAISLLRSNEGYTVEEQPGEIAMRISGSLNDGPVEGAPDAATVHELLRMPGAIIPQWDAGNGWAPFIDRAHVYTRGHKGEGRGMVRFVAYDPLFAVQKSEFEKLYLEGASGRDILLDVFQTWGLPLGQIDGPNVAMPKMPLRGTLGQSIHDVLKTAFFRGDEEYMVRWRDGAVDVVQTGQNEVIYWLAGHLNTPGAESEEDIHDLITEVHIVGETTNAIADDAGPGAPMRPRIEQIVRSDFYPAFGKLRAVVKSGEADTEDTVAEAAEMILAERGFPRRTQTVPSVDIPPLRKGDIVRITAGVLDGYYPVAGYVRDTASRQITLTIDNAGTLARRLRRVKSDRKAMLRDDPG